jgi:iduronate 2-sulfatase
MNHQRSVCAWRSFASAVVCISLAGLVSGAPAAEAKKLNVLLIVADDLNNSLGCYGHAVVKSPNIDRLASRGVRFDRAYCNYPVCNASRTSFLSGRRPDTTGIVDNVTPPRTFLKDAVMLPEHFLRSGYTTIKVGKIFHTGKEFEDPRSWDLDIVERSTAKNPPEEQILRKQGKSGVVLQADDADTWDGFVARKAVELIEQSAKEDKPFFVAAGFRRPHSPYIAPEKYFALYEAGTLVPRSGPPQHLTNIPDLALTYRLGAARFPEKLPGDTIAAYYASISFMDAQVGVLLAALDRLQLWDNTVVVFHSDHGYHLGEHGGLWHKMCLFEETARVPLIVAAPGRMAGAASLRLVELVDVFPSLADLCGLAQPPGLEGLSFLPLLDNPARDWKQAAFTVVSRGANIDATKSLDSRKMGRTVVTSRWRYTEWHDGTRELYDHHADPFEYANLALDANRSPAGEALQKLLHAGWQAALPAAQ